VDHVVSGIQVQFLKPSVYIGDAHAGFYAVGGGAAESGCSGVLTIMTG